MTRKSKRELERAIDEHSENDIGCAESWRYVLSGERSLEEHSRRFGQ